MGKEIKICCRCKLEFPISDFYPNKSTSDGFAYHCKTCAKDSVKRSLEKKRLTEKGSLQIKEKYKREYQNRKHKLTPKEYNREIYLKQTFGLTHSDYLIMLSKQDNICPICINPLPTSEGNIDHCHKRGTIRGVLCSSCNKGIGFLKDDINNLYRAIDYLSSFEGTEFLSHVNNILKTT